MTRLLVLIQILLLVRAVRRFMPPRLEPVPIVQSTGAVDVSVIVPVLNEVERLAPCLRAIQAMPVREALVVDGGSIDGTQDMVLKAGMRLIDASPVPSDWNGKAWGLETGCTQASSEWLLCIDADVRPAPSLAASLVSYAERHQLDALSIATTQILADAVDGMVHPSMLATIVYRFGPPGHVFETVGEATANGQVLLLRSSVIKAVGFDAAKWSRCEDVTLARLLVSKGFRVAFVDAPDLATVQMYASGLETWANWARSLPLNDQFSTGWAGLFELLLLQALPLPLLFCGKLLFVVQFCLLGVRIGLLAGMARAYSRRPWSYWLSPVVDPVVVAWLVISRLRRRQQWRGRALRDEV